MTCLFKSAVDLLRIHWVKAVQIEPKFGRETKLEGKEVEVSKGFVHRQQARFPFPRRGQGCSKTGESLPGKIVEA